MTNTQTTATDEAPISIVPASRDSLAYVLSTWGRIVEKKLEATPQHGFLKAFAPIQAKIIKRSKVLTAMRGDRIVGFVVYEPAVFLRDSIEKDFQSWRVVHWISVREEERRKGVGRSLLAATDGGLPAKNTVTFWTSDLRHLGLATAPYTPFWLRS